MIAGSFTPICYLGFLCDELIVYRWVYLGSLWLICLAASLSTFFPDRTTSTFRAIVFVAAGLSILPGCIHLKFWVDPAFLQEFNIKLVLLGGGVYIGGAMIYAFSVPERCYKQTFDIFGASHQIFHFCVLIGALLHIKASMLLYLNRVEYPCPIGDDF